MPPSIKLEHPTTKSNNEDLNVSLPTSKICRACGAVGVKHRCGACRQVYFCDRACQKAIWVAHRPECQQLIANANVHVASNETNVGESHVALPVTDQSTQEEQLHGSPPSPAAITSSTSRPCSPTDKKKAVVLMPVPEVLAVVPPAEEIPLSSSSSSAKKKKKNKKKKTRSNSLHAPASVPMAPAKLKSRSHSLSVKKHVVWGHVRAREFSRFPGGGSAVPYDGSWALGLGSPVADVQLGSVLEVDELRLNELEARAKELTKSQRAKVREGETRQFDYRGGVRNPLFGRLSERERRKLFSESELRHLHELEEQVAHRKRSTSVSSEASSTSTSASSSPGGGGAFSTEPLEADFACVATEQLNEFVVIRDSRDDACGCSCGDLLKKVAKMNVKKLQQFLSARRVQCARMAKSELLAQAKAIAMREQNCSTAVNCECTRNGVGCHANVCSGCAGDCHNPHDQYAYDKDKVLQYRKQMIAQWKEQQQQHLNQHQESNQRASVCVA